MVAAPNECFETANEGIDNPKLQLKNAANSRSNVITIGGKNLIGPILFL